MKKQQKSLNNKGFSLVELIIVIAIMAILIGVMAPQLLKYIEKTRVSSDTQLADTVRTAFVTAMMDPTVIEDASYATDIASFSSAVSLTNVGTNEFGNAVAETLGLTGGGDVTASWITSQLKSKDASDITVQIIGSNKVQVTITGSHADGKPSGDPIVIE